MKTKTKNNVVAAISKNIKGKTRSMKKLTTAAMAALAAILIAQNPAFGAGQGTPQGSIGLQNFDVALCYHNDTAWSLSKDAQDQPVYSSPGIGTVTWLVNAVKGATTPNEFIVYGYVTVTNAGSGTATLGNIVVNLQKRINNTWGSVAADISTKAQGDVSATLGAFADIVAAGSQEDPANNPAGNYALGANLPACSSSASVGTFYTTAGSIKLQFFNEDDNSEWSMQDVTLNTVPPGGTRHLLYKAYFDGTLVNAGDQVRVETLVTFGNAGARGGSGASLPNVDIDMDGAINGVASCTPIQAGPEDNVRTVPTRFSTTMPGLINCNSTVRLQDGGPELNPLVDPNTVTSDTSPFPTIDLFLTDSSGQIPVTIDVNGGPSGGSVCNEATLKGVNCNYPASLDCALSLNIVTLAGPMTVSEPCCIGVNLTAKACVTVEAVPPQGFNPGAYCTFTQGGWGSKPNGGNPGAILANGFSTVYPGGSVTVGGGTYTMTFQSQTTTVTKKVKGKTTTTTTTVLAPSFIELYLPAGKTPRQLNATLINPDKSHAGVFGGQVLALQLNVDFSAAGIGPSGLGGLHYCAGDLPSIQGLTISQILAKANAVLGGATTASQWLLGQDSTPMTISQLNDLIDQLNQAFDDCTPTKWANQHLCP